MKLDRFLEALARSQEKRTWAWLLAIALVAAGSVPMVMGLKLDSSWVAMLPHDKPSVHDLDVASGRVGGMTTLTLVFQSKNTDALMRLTRDVVPRLERLQAERVYSVEWNVHEYEDFVVRHKHLYASLDDLHEVRTALEERLDYERARANPFYVDLGDEVPPSPEEIVSRMQKRAEEAHAKQARFPGGFYIHPNGDFLVVFVRTDLSGGDFDGTNRLLDAIRREVDALHPATYAPDLTLEFAGELMHGREEHQAIKDELVLATSLTFVLTLVVMYLFFFSFRAIPLLGATALVTALASFAWAKLSVGSLNTSTAFLGSILLGNGINPSIIWLARYYEERRRGRTPSEAMAIAHKTTFTATLSASFAAAIAYGSLVVTDFRGFRDFGIIGGVGMVLCWLGTVTVIPSLTIASERVRPIVQGDKKPRRGAYGPLFYKLLSSYPRTLIVLTSIFTVVCAGFVVHAVKNDPMEYDFRNLRSADRASTRVSELHKRINQYIPKSGSGNGIAMLVDAPEDAAFVVDELTEMRDQRHGPFGRVRTIDDLLPKDQAAKIVEVRAIRALLEDAKRFANDTQRRQIEENEPPEDVRPLVAEDLPESVARLFTERDGTRGRIIMIEAQDGRSVWDGRYLIDWSRALREVRTPEGERPPLVGRAPVFADMLEVVLADGPKAILVSIVLTALLVLASFKRRRFAFVVMASLTVGLTWMCGVMAMFGMKLNFLNFVSLPISCGNGADYGVNVMQRYDQEGGGSQAVKTTVEDSGGAVVLCSLTTIIGYSSLHVSANQALRSFGMAMTISELMCLLAAVITLPAVLLVIAKRREQKSA